jgi:hypothetical protein
MRYRRRNASRSILLLEVCGTFRPIFNPHIFEQVQMTRRHPARTQVLPCSRNCRSRAACQIDIGTKSFLVAYPARAVGLEILVGSREFVTLCAMRTRNWLGSVSVRAIRLPRCRRWRFRQFGIGRLRRNMFAVRKYVLQCQLMDNSDSLLL